MFKKTERLSQAEFQEYFKVGARQHSKYFTFITRQQSNRKVAVVVGKKVFKSAVKRNKMKRCIFAVLRSDLPTMAFMGVLIVIVKPAAASLSKKELAIQIASEVAQVCKSA